MAPQRLLVGLLTMVLVALVGVPAACGGDATPAPESATVTVHLGLARDQDGLASAAAAANDPGAAARGQFLGLDEVARLFGATSDDVAAVRAELEEVGATGTLDPSGGFLTATMTVEQAESLLDIEIERATTSDGTEYLRPTGELTVPDALAPAVTEVVGVSRTVAAGSSQGASTTTSAAGTSTTLDPAGCSTATEAVTSLHDRYGISALHGAGHDGAGSTVAVVSLDVPDPRSLRAWADCLGVTVPATEVTPVDGTTGSAGEAEIDVDLATLTAGLPGSGGFEVYVFDRYGWIGAPVAAALAGDEEPTMVSTSIGFCESELADDAVHLAEWVLATAAALGTSVVAAAGDDGSSACAPTDTGAAVQYPSSSPWVTAVGGTQVGPDGTGEVVWNDTSTEFAGGGGASIGLDRPDWQSGADAGPAGDGRLVPDLSALADPESWPPVPVCGDSGCAWQREGGTSAAAPLVAAGLVLTEQARDVAGAPPVGFWNPTLYAGAGAGSGAITDVTEGDNDLYDIGCCGAATGYDPASGLGVADFSALVAAMP